MGNETAQSSIITPKPIQNLELTHIGQVTLMQLDQQYCLLKVFSYSDHFLMEDRLRKLKVRTNKLSNNNSVLNVYQAQKRELKELCAHNYQLLTYIEKPDQTLAVAISRRLQLKKNYSQEQIYHFLGKVVDSLIYIQDNGLKNIHLDSNSIVFCGNNVKILDIGLACSKTYYQLLEYHQKGEKYEQCFYLPPQLLKEMQQLNYDPYISPKADIFSLGMLVMEMIALEPMQGYYDYSKASIDYDSLIHRLSRITHSLSLKTLIAEMLQYDPVERIGLLSLKEKVQRLKSPTEQGFARSKSSKMLQEILSHSRRSSSICRQSQQSGSLTRQPSSEKKVTKIELRCSGKKSEENYRTETEPAVAPLTTRLPQTNFQDQMDSTSQNNLKNLVKNKLRKGGKETETTKIYRPFKHNTLILQQPKQIAPIRHMLDESKNSCFDSSISSRIHKKSINTKQNKQNSIGVLPTLNKLVQQSGIKKLLKIEQLDSSLKNRGNIDSIKNTSRFGSNEQNQVYNKIKSRPADFYIQQYKQQEYNIDTNEIQQPQPKHQKNLHKMMTFNKESLFNARSVQQSIQEPKLIERSQDKISFSPISAYIGKNQPSNIESSVKKIIIKDVPVVISQEKSYLRGPVPMNLGTLQRKLNIMEYAESIQQDSSLNSSFNNNNSKVIESYCPKDEDSSSIQQQKPSIEVAAPFKKPRSKKPQLMIYVDQEPSQTPPSLPITLQQAKPNLENYDKTTQSIEHLSNFTSISPPRDNEMTLDLINLGFSPEIDTDYAPSFKLPTTDEYSGQMLGEIPHGNGVLHREGKLLYSGQFKLGKYNGFGTLYNLNFQSEPVDHNYIDFSRNYWNRFEGQFEYGFMNGFGTIYFSEGVKLCGNLKQGVLQGYGCFYRDDRKPQFSGLWSKNKLLKI